MKYIYSLLLLLFATTQLSAENWVKYDVSTKNVIFLTGDCFKLKDGKVDSIDIDCTATLRSISLHIGATDYISKTQSDEIFSFFPNVNTLNVENNIHADTTVFELLPDQITRVNVNRLQTTFSYVQIKGKNIDSIQINSRNQSLSTSLPDNLKYLRITHNVAMTGGSSDPFTLIGTWPNQLKTFLCERSLSQCEENLPLGLENFGVRLAADNYLYIYNLLIKNKNLPNFNLLTLYSNNEFEYYNLSAINHIKRLSLEIPHNHYLADGNFNIEQLPEQLDYLKTDKVHIIGEVMGYSNIKSLHINEYPAGVSYRTIQQLLNYLPDLDTLIITNQDLERLESIPETLKSLQLHNIPQLTCLPTFHPNLKSFEGSNLGVDCIPNENMWIRETEEWPLCKDSDKICNSTSLMSISGSVYIDVNMNQVIDEEDILAHDAIVKGNGEYSSSFRKGQYRIAIHEAGEYTLELFTPYDNIISITPAQANAVVNEANPHDTIDFLVQLQPNTNLEIIGINSVARPGMTAQLSVFVKNRNILPANNSTIKILAPAEWSRENILPDNYTISNDTLIWNNIDVKSFETEHFGVSFKLPATASILGDTYQYEMWVENEGDITPENNYYSIIDTIIGSYDPNDKIVNHSTLTPELSNSKELIYTIRFQNTGTDTAFQVIIVDSIIGNLDPSTIRIIGASHNYTWNYTGAGIATFVFDNILLPDSNVNEPGSHGFVTLALRPGKDLVVGDSIYNRAGIYFDFNEPVITNHANTRIATVTPVYSHSNIPLSIYPNPAKNQVRVEWKVSEPAILRISDISGKIIRTERLNNGFTDINVSQLPKGLYIVQLQAGQNMAVSKLIVQ